MLRLRRASVATVQRRLTLLSQSFMHSGDRQAHKKRRISTSDDNAGLQRLYKAARAAFRAGHCASSYELTAVSQALGSIGLDELGFSAHHLDKLNSEKSWWSPKTPAITYQHIFEDRDVSIGIFSLAKGAKLPLHNHPGMTVLSRVLYGRMHILSFDWADAEAMSSSIVTQQKEAICIADHTQQGGDAPSILHARSGGNLHQFTAEESCAVLDVLAPPYAPHDAERDCTYFRVKSTHREHPKRAILEPFSPPADFQVTPVSYRGMRVVPEG